MHIEKAKYQQQVRSHDAERINKRHLDDDYAIRQRVKIRKDRVHRKAKDRNTSSWTISQVNCNGTVRIQYSSMSERKNTRGIDPFFSKMIITI